MSAKKSNLPFVTLTAHAFHIRTKSAFSGKLFSTTTQGHARIGRKELKPKGFSTIRPMRAFLRYASVPFLADELTVNLNFTAGAFARTQADLHPLSGERGYEAHVKTGLMEN